MTAAPISRDCPVCGGQAAAACLQKGELRLVRCRACAMIYANPAPAEYALGQYYDRAGTDYYLSPAKLESDYAPVRFDIVEVLLAEGVVQEIRHLPNSFPMERPYRYG